MSETLEIVPSELPHDEIVALQEAHAAARRNELLDAAVERGVAVDGGWIEVDGLRVHPAEVAAHAEAAVPAETPKPEPKKEKPKAAEPKAKPKAEKPAKEPVEEPAKEEAPAEEPPAEEEAPAEKK